MSNVWMDDGKIELASPAPGNVFPEQGVISSFIGYAKKKIWAD